MRRLRAVTFFFALVLSFLLLAPSMAFAESSGGGDIDSDPGLLEPPWNTVIYGPIHTIGTTSLEVGICAASKFDAAMVALGYDSAFIDLLSADTKARLSNSSTGGKFWELAQKFSNPSNDVVGVELMYWSGLSFLYGSGNVWRGQYTEEDASLADDALHSILEGGGSGSDEIEGDYVYFDCTPTGYVGNQNDFVGVALDSMYVKKCQETIKANPDEDLQLWIAYGQYAYGAFGNISILLMSKMPIINYSNYTYTWPGTFYWGNNSYVNGYGVSVEHNGRSYLRLDTGTNNTTPFQVVSTTNPIMDAVRPLYGYYWGAVNPDSTNTPAPPTNWPDKPEVTAPTAPEVPEPSQPELPSQPVMPTAPDLPDFPSNIISPGSSYDTFDIQAILNAMDEHCQHLQSAIYQGFADYFDTFTPWLDERLDLLQECIRGESVWQIQRIDADFESLKDYLHDLFEWLADQMQFTFTGDSYNDSTVVSWLRRIYYKLQGSPVNTRPADPVANPDDAWDWLWQLLQDILTGLTGGATELVGKLMSLFDGIKDKFPFSVPWDLAAVLALLDVPAQTPAFVVSYDVFGTTVTYDIDLHFMDEYAGVIRSMESVLFCFMLIKNTKWLTGIFDEVGQFLGTKLGYRG